MRLERPSGGEIAARRRKPDTPDPCQQRTDEQHRPAKPTDQAGVGLVPSNLSAAHPQRRRAHAAHLRTETLQKLDHDADISDSRDIVQLTRFFGEHTGREKRKRGILVSLNVDLT
jgi:hypothetical protein